jgi:hypothetical protein
VWALLEEFKMESSSVVVSTAPKMGPSLKTFRAALLRHWNKWIKWSLKALACILAAVSVLWVAGMVLTVLIIGGQSFYHLFFTDGPLSQQVGNPFEDYRCFSALQVEIFGWIFAVMLALVGVCTILGSIAARHNKRMAEEREKENGRKRELEAARKKGIEEGAAAERAIIRRALIHAFKPRMELPAIPDGHRRLFWINVRMSHDGARPIEYRMIQFFDMQLCHRPPDGYIGAPHYNWVDSPDARDRLAIMGVIYELDTKPSVW